MSGFPGGVPGGPGGVFAPNLPQGGDWVLGPAPWTLDGPASFWGVGGLTTVTERITKRAAERRWVNVPFSRALGGSALASASAALVSGDVEVVTAVLYSQTVAKVMVGAGTAGTTSTIRLTVTAEDAQVITHDFEAVVTA